MVFKRLDNKWCFLFRLKSSLEEALATNREQASDIANLQDELRKIHSSFQVILVVLTEFQ